MTDSRALRRGESVWYSGGDHAQSSKAYPSLRGHLACDVAIIGGGFTGALIAEAFAAEGVAVSVLERGCVGCGSTAASAALLLKDLDHGLASLSRRYGRAAGQRIWRLSHEAVRDLVGAIRKHRVACDLVERDAVHVATTADAVRRLRAEHRLRLNAGFANEWLTAEALAELIGVPGRGGIRSRGHAQFDPYRASVGIMQAAAAMGATVFERSAVTRIAQRAGGVSVHTRDGRVDASRVIIATGYATKQFRPLVGRFRMYHTYVLATPPLSAEERARVGLGDVMIWDTERPYHYARWTQGHRLLMGGADRRVRGGRPRSAQFAAATRELLADFATMLPGLDGIEVDRAWEGLFAATPDSLPYIGPHRRYPKHLFALGYSGNGMTFAALAARLLLEHWRGIRSPDQDLFAFRRLR